jgi:hypothetical protein
MNCLRWANSWRAHNLSASMLRWFDGVQELVAEEVLRRGTWPEDTAVLSPRRQFAACLCLLSIYFAGVP